MDAQNKLLHMFDMGIPRAANTPVEFQVKVPKIRLDSCVRRKCVLADFLNQLSVGGMVSLGWSGTNSWQLSRPKFVAAQ